MWYKNIASRFFELFTKHACDKWTDRTMTPKTAWVQYPTFHACICFYDIQWKQICGIPFILESHNNTDTTNIKMQILNQVQVNLIYNTNRNLFLRIEIFISITDLYNTTADRWSCHLPNRNKKLR